MKHINEYLREQHENINESIQEIQKLVDDIEDDYDDVLCYIEKSTNQKAIICDDTSFSMKDNDLEWFQTTDGSYVDYGDVVARYVDNTAVVVWSMGFEEEKWPGHIVEKIVKASKGPEQLFKKKGYFVDMFILELKQHIIRTFRCTVNEEGEIYCILSIDEKL